MSTKQKLEAETAIINTFKKLKDQLDDVRRDVINAIQVITDKNRDTGVESTTTDEFKQDTIEEEKLPSDAKEHLHWKYLIQLTRSRKWNKLSCPTGNNVK